MNLPSLIKQQAYSLVELMTIVCIVAVIAGLAIPAYISYSIRTKVSEGISQASSFQEQVAYFYTLNGDFPNQNSDLEFSDGGIFSTSIIQSVNINSNGVITVAFEQLGGTTETGDTITFAPSQNSGSISWNCTETGDGTIPEQYRPIVCRA